MHGSGAINNLIFKKKLIFPAAIKFIINQLWLYFLAGHSRF